MDEPKENELKESPAFLFYAANFLAKTAAWSASEVGCYVRLRASEWCNGPLPFDLKRLSKLCGVTEPTMKKFWDETIGPMFKNNGGGTIVDQELEDIRSERHKYREWQAKKAREVWEKRKSNSGKP
jgi:uncharacterized protein YdaU (DUF1376 family)